MKTEMRDSKPSSNKQTRWWEQSDPTVPRTDLFAVIYKQITGAAVRRLLAWQLA